MEVVDAPQARPIAAAKMPLPRDARTILQGILCLVAVIASLYLAREIALPVVIAMVLKLLLQPPVRILERVRVPKAVGALIALILLVGVLVGLGMLLSTPAACWAADLPGAWPQLQQRFASSKEPVGRVRPTLEQMGVEVGNPGALLSDPAGIATPE